MRVARFIATNLDFNCRALVLRGFIPGTLTTQRKTETSHTVAERLCPVCGSSEHQPYWQKHDLRIVHCAQCGMVFVNPAPAGMASGDYYNAEASAYYLSPAKLESDYAPVRFERELKLFREFCPRGMVLDVGCGSGGFLFQLQRRWPDDYDAFGTDVSGAPLDYAESRGVRVVRGNFLDPGWSLQGRAGGPTEVRFDAITFWAVVEHLAEPKKFLAKAHDLLRPGGVCFVLVPNLQSLAVRLLGKKYRYVYAQHLNYFSASTLARLARSPGFEVAASRYTHFNPLVIWQDWRLGGREISNAERGELLKRTTAYKQKRWLLPVKWCYALAEKTVGALKLADNLVLVLRK